MAKNKQSEAERREKRRIQQNKRRHANPEKTNKYQRDYYAKNKEKILPKRRAARKLKNMLKIKRVEKGQENKFTVSSPSGYITVAGTDEFVTRMIKDLCQTSEEFLNIFRETLRGMTHADVAAEMRRGGFSEDIVRDFENDNFWDDVIYEK